MARLGLALAAAVLGLTSGAAGAAADPAAAATVYDLDMTATFDKNRNREYDEGEAQPHVDLTWVLQLHHERTWTVRTGENGEFRLDLPTGGFSVTGEGHAPVTVIESSVDGLRLRGTAPISVLVPTLEFTKDSYAPDEDPWCG